MKKNILVLIFNMILILSFINFKHNNIITTNNDYSNEIQKLTLQDYSLNLTANSYTVRPGKEMFFLTSIENTGDEIVNINVTLVIEGVENITVHINFMLNTYFILMDNISYIFSSIGTYDIFLVVDTDSETFSEMIQIKVQQEHIIEISWDTDYYYVIPYDNSYFQIYINNIGDFDENFQISICLDNLSTVMEVTTGQFLSVDDYSTYNINIDIPSAQHQILVLIETVSGFDFISTHEVFSTYSYFTIIETLIDNEFYITTTNEWNIGLKVRNKGNTNEVVTVTLYVNDTIRYKETDIHIDREGYFDSVFEHTVDTSLITDISYYELILEVKGDDFEEYNFSWFFLLSEKESGVYPWFEQHYQVECNRSFDIILGGEFFGESALLVNMSFFANNSLVFTCYNYLLNANTTFAKVISFELFEGYYNLSFIIESSENTWSCKSWINSVYILRDTLIFSFDFNDIIYSEIETSIDEYFQIESFYNHSVQVCYNSYLEYYSFTDTMITNYSLADNHNLDFSPFEKKTISFYHYFYDAGIYKLFVYVTDFKSEEWLFDFEIRVLGTNIDMRALYLGEEGYMDNEWNDPEFEVEESKKSNISLDLQIMNFGNNTRIVDIKITVGMDVDGHWREVEIVFLDDTVLLAFNVTLYTVNISFDKPGEYYDFNIKIYNQEDTEILSRSYSWHILGMRFDFNDIPSSVSTGEKFNFDCNVISYIKEKILLTELKIFTDNNTILKILSYNNELYYGDGEGSWIEGAAFYTSGRHYIIAKAKTDIGNFEYKHAIDVTG